jgi:hypothetical protein
VTVRVTRPSVATTMYRPVRPQAHVAQEQGGGIHALSRREYRALTEERGCVAAIDRHARIGFRDDAVELHLHVESGSREDLRAIDGVDGESGARARPECRQYECCSEPHPEATCRHAGRALSNGHRTAPALRPRDSLATIV